MKNEKATRQVTTERNCETGALVEDQA